MSVGSPFYAAAALPQLAALRGVSAAGGPRHVVVLGLLGAARSLVAGALGLARGKALPLTPDSLRSSRPSPHGGEGKRPPSVVVMVVDGPETALDTVADLRSFMALHDGPFLESAFFPAWDVLPTESDHPEGLTLGGRRLVTDKLREIKNETAPSPYPLPTGERDTGGDARATTPSALVPPARRSGDYDGENQKPETRNLKPLFPAGHVIVAPITALLQPCEAPDETADTILLRAGAEHDPILLGRQLGEAGYERTGQVEVRGEFSLRGGILDIFPYTSDTPYRVDFLGDTIETIRPFDPLTQRSEDPVDFISFANASPGTLRRLFSPGASRGPFSLLDHLPPGALLIFQEPHVLRQRAELYQASLVTGHSICLPLEELLKQARSRFDTLQLANVVSDEKEEPADAKPIENRKSKIENATGWLHELGEREPLEVACTTLQRLHGEVAAHAGAWKKLAAERQQLIILCETAGHRHRLQTLLDEAGVTPAPHLRLALGKLSGSFDLRATGLAVISDREILGLSHHPAGVAPSTRKKHHVAGAVAIQHLVELELGDYVVHAAHGIARYLGLARLEKSGRTEDYLTLLFANDVKLYVPAAHIGWVSKYIGGAAQLELSTLGGRIWARKKERAAKAIRDIAEDLLRIQAARRSLPGIVYPPDGEWQDEFEKAFPYEETPDQLSAIELVKEDMEGTCPMDRLLCGDVGFGKTEVALRAAFKAACSGKQVAVLAPTTLLVEQHGRTFTERFSGYPLGVEVLSRFKTAGRQRAILERLAAGRVDVVIGTHRLLQKDVAFKDLGLAVIDEEQRFGVEHKEFFKHLRKSVDVLTLTATPIPRTLHMAMIGLRDISNLATPPRNRRSILTKVARFSGDLVRRAVLREISRGGQVFVVYPRVFDIDEFRDNLARLVPEARFAVGHGQMDSDSLEEVMAAFLRAEVDVLVSTTIVESGLDIPTANTILIHDAGRFGLAELHQLRGRVGRSDVQAYCYLLIPQHSTVTQEGMRRLRALEEFDELGAGFQLALKDLEIRGAGNVLGREQSGEIAEIGYDLYCKLLESTVKELRGEVVEEEVEVNLQLRGAAYIPEEYVQDEKTVLELYRRLQSLRTDEDINALKAEAVDRFGPLPPPAERMFEEAKLRHWARVSRVPYVGLDNAEGRLIFKLHEWDLKMADRALRGLPESRGVRILDDETLSFALTLRSKHNEDALHELVRNLLEPLALLRKTYGTVRSSPRPATAQAQETADKRG